MRREHPVGPDSKSRARSLKHAKAAVQPKLFAQRMSCACGGGCPRCQEKSQLQAKLQVSQPGDALEQEADRVAEQVRREPQATPVDNRGSNEVVSLRVSGRSSGSPPESSQEAPPGVDDVLRTDGEPLDTAMRSFMEPRFGYDFSGVRVHTGARAAESAQAISALAYTVGRDIAFREGQYAPDTPAGRGLLAHELAHVVQQSSRSTGTLHRKPVTGYETKGIEFERAKLETWTDQDYWSSLFRDNGYQIVHIVPTGDRLKADAEERDAVLSVAWRVRPKDRETAGTRVVTIPARPAAKGSKAVTYKFRFVPKKKADTDVQVEFIAESAAAAALAAPVPAAGFKPTPVSLTHVGFPGRDIDAYWKQNPDEKLQVFNFIENAAGSTFDQVVTTTTSKKVKKKTTTRDASFHVEGRKDSTGAVQDLEIKFLGAVAPTEETPPADYADKAAIDVEIEKAQTPDPKGKKKPLGQIKDLDKAPADERPSVKVAVRAYFKGGTRNAEVDALVPIANTSRIVHYTLRFEPDTNDVTVQRIGEEGKDVKVTPTEFNIARVRGYAENSGDVKSLSAWLTARYPSITATGKSVEELRANASAEMERNAGTADWFKVNYDLQVLDSADGEERLRKIHGVSKKQTAGMKDFDPEELKLVEFALQPMSGPILGLVRGTRLARQDVRLNLVKGKAVPVRKTAGRTYQNGSERTIVLYDSMTENAGALFAGGVEGVRSQTTQTPAHEFGHVVESQEGILKAFTAFVKKKKIDPITWYARSDKAGESFTEAFALYDTDPEWMRINLPDLFAWFEELSKTGKPPK